MKGLLRLLPLSLALGLLHGCSGFVNSFSISGQNALRTPSNNFLNSVLDAEWGGTFQVASSSDGSFAVAYALSDSKVFNFETFGTLISQVGGSDVVVVKYSSAGEALWYRRIGSSATEQSKFLYMDTAGKVYSVGTYLGSGDITDESGTILESFAGAGSFVVEFSSTGAIDGLSLLNGAATPFVDYSAMDSTGALVVGGRFFGASIDIVHSLGTSTLTNAGNNDVFVVRISSGGVLEFARRLGSTSTQDFIDGLAVDSTNSVYVMGRFPNMAFAIKDTADATVDSIAAGDFGVYFAKFNTTGSLQFLNSARQASGVGVEAFEVDTNGITFVGSFTAGPVTYFENGVPSTTFAHLYNRSLAVLRLSFSGSVLWRRSFHANSNPVYASGLRADSTGNVYVAGYFWTDNLVVRDGGSTVFTATEGAGSSYTGYLLRFDTNGDVDRSFLVGRDEWSLDSFEILSNSDGSVLVAGYFGSANLDIMSGTGTTLDTLPFGGGYSAFVFKIDSSGSYDWGYSLYTPTEDIGTADLHVEASGAVHVNGSVDGGALTIGSSGGTIGSHPSVATSYSAPYHLKLGSDGSFNFLKVYEGAENSVYSWVSNRALYVIQSTFTTLKDWDRSSLTGDATGKYFISFSSD